jgi:hypothetical protein
MADAEQQQQNSTRSIAAQAAAVLSKFASWLVLCSQCTIRHSQCDGPSGKYYLVLAALSEHQVDRVKNSVEMDPNENSFQRICDALVASHTLTPFQQVDRIATMDHLNGRKPSELLTEMETSGGSPLFCLSFSAAHAKRSEDPAGQKRQQGYASPGRKGRLHDGAAPPTSQ